MNDPNKLTAIAYCRVSTGRQQAEGVSLEAQQAKIAAWASLANAELAHVYVDAISGKRSDNRPELQLALDHVCRVNGVLVVYSLSRLARNTADTLAIAKRLDKANANLASVSERIDTTTAAGKMVFRLLAVLAEFERDVIAERTKMAMGWKRNQMEVVGSVPYGYAADCAGRLTADPSEASTVAMMRQWRAEGAGLREVARRLNAAGIRAKRGGEWSAEQVKSVLLTTESLAKVG